MSPSRVALIVPSLVMLSAAPLYWAAGSLLCLKKSTPLTAVLGMNSAVFLLFQHGVVMNDSYLCHCGFDCTDFVRQHQISGGSFFECPKCENKLAVQQVPVASKDIGQAASTAIPFGRS